MNFSDELIRKLFDRLVVMTQQITGVVEEYKSNKEIVKEIKVLLWSTELQIDEIMQGHSCKLFTPQKEKKPLQSVQQLNCEKHKISAVIFLN